MKRKEFYSLLSTYEFYKVRTSGKHEIYRSERYGTFPIPRGGNIVSLGIVWNLERKVKKTN